MKNSELIKDIATKTGMSQTNVKAVLTGLQEVSVEALHQNKTISIANLVTLKGVSVEEKTGESFGKAWTSPAHTSVKASVSSKYKKLG